jgi:hypothetical protein
MVQSPNPIAGEAARGALQGDVPAAAEATHAAARATLDAQELHDLEQELYYPAATAAPAPAPVHRSLVDRVRALIAR